MSIQTKEDFNNQILALTCTARAALAFGQEEKLYKCLDRIFKVIMDSNYQVFNDN